MNLSKQIESLLKASGALLASGISLVCAAGLLAYSNTASAACTALDQQAPEAAVRPLDKWQAIANARQLHLSDTQHRILIVGDSIGERWPDELQTQFFDAPFAKFAISGDKIENVLWRLNHADLTVASPVAVVLIIGTNNLSVDDPPCKVVSGIVKVVSTIKAQLKTVPIIVIGLPPRGPNFSYKKSEITEINSSLAALATDGSFRLLTVNDEVEQACGGKNPCPLYADMTHFSPEGYTLLSKDLRPLLR